MCAATPAFAQSDDGTRAAARSLGTAGVEAYQAGDFRAAHDKLEKAYRILKVPSLGLWSARALVKVGKLVEAGERYLEVTRLTIQGGDTGVQKQAQADAQSELDALGQRIPSVVVQVEGADASTVSITLDGEAISNALVGEKRPVDPGAHHVEGTRGADHVSVDVKVAEGGSSPAVLHFSAETSAGAVPAAAAGAEIQPPPGAAQPIEDHVSAGSASPLRTAGFVALGVGGAGLVLGGITGVVALGKHSSLKDDGACSDLHCNASESSQVNSYNSMRTVSSIGFIAGGVIAATGLVLVLTAPKNGETTALTLAPGALFLRRQF